MSFLFSNRNGKNSDKLKDESNEKNPLNLCDSSFISMFNSKNQTIYDLFAKIILQHKLSNYKRVVKFHDGFISICGIKIEIWKKNWNYSEVYILSNLIDTHLSLNPFKHDMRRYDRNLNVISETIRWLMVDVNDKFIDYSVSLKDLRFGYEEENENEVNELSTFLINLYGEIENTNENMFIDDESIYWLKESLNLNDNEYNCLNNALKNQKYVSELLGTSITNLNGDASKQIKHILNSIQGELNHCKDDLEKATEYVIKNNLLEKYRLPCLNLLKMLSKENFYNFEFIKQIKILIVELYPKLSTLLEVSNADISLIDNKDTIDFIKAYKELIDENEHFENRSDNDIFNQYIAYFIARTNIIELLAEDVKKEFKLKDRDNIDDYILDYLNNSSIVHEDEINMIKLSYFMFTKIEDNRTTKLSNVFTVTKSFVEKNINNKKKDYIRKKLLSNETDYGKKETTIEDIDLMSGIEFENFIGGLFFSYGYKYSVTKASGDQGIDVILEKDGQKIGVQCKRYNNKISNSAIQEVVAGISYYHLDKAIVVTNNYFTKSAEELARANNVELWDRDVLKLKLNNL